MRVYDLVELAGRNLRQAFLRNVLTTVGISVGVASLVAMLSLGIGLQKLASRLLGRSGLFDTIFVSSRPEFRARRQANRPIPAPPKPLDDGARRTFSKIPEVLEVYPIISAAGEFRVEGRADDPHFGVIGGLPASARTNEAFDDFQGTFYSSDDAPEVILLADFGRELLNLPSEPRNSDQALKPEQAAQLLGKEMTFSYFERESLESPPAPASKARPPASPPLSGSEANGDQKTDNLMEEVQSAGATFNVVRRQRSAKIVGILSSEPYRGARGGNTAVFLPMGFAESLNMIQPGDLRSIMRPGQGKAYNALVIRVAKSQNVERVEESIRQQGYDAFSVLDFSKRLRIWFFFLDLFLGVFGSLALAVASLGIVNTMVMAILERRREIGVMKALGASDGDVKRIFFVEAGSMGALGGGLGVALGWGIGRAINLGTNFWMTSQDLKAEDFWYVPWWLVGAAVTFSVIVSLMAGLYPASRAARLDPVQTLRHD